MQLTVIMTVFFPSAFGFYKFVEAVKYLSNKHVFYLLINNQPCYIGCTVFELNESFFLLRLNS